MKSGPLGLSRRALLALAGALNATRFATAADETEAPKKKVLRIAFRTAETGFDPAQINDLYSRSVTPHIFEGLYTYDHLARPYKIKPLTADGMPVSSADFKVWTIKYQARHLLRRRPRLPGQEARARGPGLRLLLQA